MLYSAASRLNNGWNVSKISETQWDAPQRGTELSFQGTQGCSDGSGGEAGLWARGLALRIREWKAECVHRGPEVVERVPLRRRRLLFGLTLGPHTGMCSKERGAREGGQAGSLWDWGWGL